MFILYIIIIITDEITYSCPHCTGTIIVEKLNCGIFRHGIFKKNGKQMDPHMKKDQCDKLSSENLIYGCGKPFRLVDGKLEQCDYL